MRCVCCNEIIEYRPKDTIYENSEDEFICGICLDSFSEDNSLEDCYDYNDYQDACKPEDFDIEYIVNKGVKQPKFYEE